PQPQRVQPISSTDLPKLSPWRNACRRAMRNTGIRRGCFFNRVELYPSIGRSRVNYDNPEGRELAKTSHELLHAGDADGVRRMREPAAVPEDGEDCGDAPDRIVAV